MGEQEYRFPAQETIQMNAATALTRADVVKAYRFLLAGSGTRNEQNQFIACFNALILHRFSEAGLNWIKNQAWADYEYGKEQQFRQDYGGDARA